jgi:hypothetical protein
MDILTYNAMKRLGRLSAFLIAGAMFGQTPAAVAPATPAPAAPAAPAASVPASGTQPEAKGPVVPTEEQQAKLIADIREAALAYAGKLPGFTCTRISRLEVQPIAPASAKGAVKADPKTPPAAGGRAQASGAAPTGKAASPSAAPQQPSQLAAMEDERITWFDQKEEVIDPPKDPRGSLPGTTGVTDFFALITGVFSEASHTEFIWRGLAYLRNVPVFVFEYKVGKEASTQELKAGATRITVGYHGLLFADRTNGKVISINFEAEVPPDFPFQKVQRLFDFGQTVLGGQFVLMPIQSLERQQGSLELLRDGKVGAKSTPMGFLTTTDFQSCRPYRGPVPKPGQ